MRYLQDNFTSEHATLGAMKRFTSAYVGGGVVTGHLVDRVVDKVEGVVRGALDLMTSAEQREQLTYRLIERFVEL